MATMNRWDADAAIINPSGHGWSNFWDHETTTEKQPHSRDCILPAPALKLLDDTSLPHRVRTDIGENEGCSSASSQPTADPTYLPEESFDSKGMSSWRRFRGVSGRSMLAGALCLVGVLAVGITLKGVSHHDQASDQFPVLPPVITPPTSSSSVTKSTEEMTDDHSSPREIVVSVVGAVYHPGLTHLFNGARVADALLAAGGVRQEAETLELNLAQKLEDGDQIVVGVSWANNSAVTPQAHRAGTSLPAQTPTRAGSVAGRAVPTKSRCDCSGHRSQGSNSAPQHVNVNSASESELDSVPGIGKVIAQAIVSYRTAHGRITTLDELATLRPIGTSRLRTLRQYLRV